jgi:RNA polymerase sigma factor (TIGR02999 family)
MNSHVDPAEAIACAVFQPVAKPVETAPRTLPVPGPANGARPTAADLELLDGLFAALYEELHRVARRESRRHRSSAIMSTTTLVHEAYLDVSRRQALAFPDTQHFVAYVSRAMRGLLIDRLRECMAQKRGGGIDFESLDGEVEYMVAQPEELDQIGEVLEELAQLDPDLAQVVDLRYLCGFSVAEVASLLDTSERTIHRRWDKARALLRLALGQPQCQ